MEKNSASVGNKKRKSFKVPDLPTEQWCDIRKDYESGMTLIAIADKYYCCTRTVKKCIANNTASKDIGKQLAPTKLSEYRSEVDLMYQNMVTRMDSSDQFPGICEISKNITREIQRKGYTGSERTVRNYLRQRFGRRH